MSKLSGAKKEPTLPLDLNNQNQLILEHNLPGKQAIHNGHCVLTCASLFEMIKWSVDWCIIGF